MTRKIFIPIILIVVSLVLSACGNFNPNPNENPEVENYYQGSQGVMMRFSPGSPPPRFYYYSTEVDNSFDISVELHNEGASDAFGSLFIGGFSPKIFEVEADGHVVGNTNFANKGSCTFSIVNMFNSNCNFNGVNSNLQFDGHDAVLNIGNLLSPLGIKAGSLISIRYDVNENKWKLGGNFYGVNSEKSYERVYHGPGMILAVGKVLQTNGLKLTAYDGIPFGDDGILFGDNYYYPGGEHNFQTFTVNVKNWPEGLDETDIPFAITSCYAYTTYAAPMICIDPNPYEETNKVCYPKEYTWSGSQGAPVAITNLKQDPTPRSTFLTFTIRNVGPGKVFNPFLLPKCSPYYPGLLLPSDMDVVFLGDVRIGDTNIHVDFDGSNEAIKCTPDQEIRLIDGVGTFTCEYRYDPTMSNSKTAYPTPVVVELWYGYRDYMERSVHIKRVG